MAETLTVQGINSIEIPAKGQRDYPDDKVSGFGFRISANGATAWTFRYRVQAGPHKGAQRRMTLNPNLSLKDARAEALDLLAHVAKGEDPARQKVLERQAEAPQVTTYPEAVEDFIEKYAKAKQRTWADTRRVLLNAGWAKRDIRSITKKDAYKVLDGMTAKRPYAAKVLLRWWRTMFKWCLSRDIIETNPMESVEIHIEERTRERCYSDDEVKALWTGADKLAILDGAFLKLLLLLGVRKNELAGMRWSELDDPENPTVWIIPHERTKSRKSAVKKRVYVVPLPDLAKRILLGLPRVAEDEADGHDIDLVFPGRHKGKPMRPGERYAAKVQQASGVEDWFAHAHRHTIATYLETEGHDEFDRGLVLNHASGSVTAGYSHGFAAERKRTVLQGWADHVASVVTAEGVQLLR